MQVVPSQRLSIAFTAAPLNLYRALRHLNPSPYMYFLDLEDFHIVGSSADILARVEDGEITVRPLAGTRHRGHTEAEDKALEAELHKGDVGTVVATLGTTAIGAGSAGRGGLVLAGAGG